jgi:hypothetical protein
MKPPSEVLNAEGISLQTCKGVDRFARKPYIKEQLNIEGEKGGVQVEKFAKRL